MTAKPSTERARNAAISFLSRGKATQAEVAKLAGASRQLVRYWAMQAGIDSIAERSNWLAREWEKELDR